MVVPLFFARKKYEINTHLIYYLCKMFLPDPLNLIQLSYMFHYFLVLYILYRNTTFVKWISSLLLQIFEMKKSRKLLLKTLLWRYDFSKLSCPREGETPFPVPLIPPVAGALRAPNIRHPTKNTRSGPTQLGQIFKKSKYKFSKCHAFFTLWCIFMPKMRHKETFNCILFYQDV